MRNTVRGLILGVAGLLAIGTRLGAQSVSRPGAGVNYAVSAVVSSFVRVTVDPADPEGGTPRIVTNDPAIRAAFNAGLHPELLGPEALAAGAPARHQGGAEAQKGIAPAGAVTIRYTVATP